MTNLKNRLALTILAGGMASAQQPLGTCQVFPANNVWNAPIKQLPVAANSATLVSTIGTAVTLHADFGAGQWAGGPIGIPFITVPGSQAKFPATFLYADQSDPGPYAIPLSAPIEGGSASSGDRHAIAVDTDNCILYELWSAYPQAASWQAGSGAIFNLNSNALRPAGWTSADAAGLPVFAGLVRYDEVASGVIRHAIRLTVPQTLNQFLWPARHLTSGHTSSVFPAMGQRFRLRASFNVSTYPTEIQVILVALQTYGMFVADNGSAWYISGAPDPRWNDNNLGMLRNIVGSDFEAVDDSAFMVNANSGQAAFCDLNTDGVVNALDVQIAVNAAIGKTACGFGDLNGNGICDVADLQRIINAALGAACHTGP